MQCSGACSGALHDNDEESFQYEVVQTASGDLLARFQTQGAAIEYARKQVTIDQAGPVSQTDKGAPRKPINSSRSIALHV